MSPKDVLETMQRKREGKREYTNVELEEMAGKSTEEKEKEAEQAEAAKVKERRTVMNTKVPT